MPDMSGRPRSSTITSGRCSAATAARSAPVGGGGHLVAAHRQVDPQRPQDLRFVVDHQHAWSWIADRPLVARRGRSRRSVRRPGCRWPRSCRPSPRRNPCATDRPRPTPMVLSWSPSRWNGANSCSSVPRGMPGPSSSDVDQHPVADPARGDAHRAVRRVAQRVVDQVGQHPLQQAAVGHRDGVADLDLDPVERSRRNRGALADSENRAVHGLLEVDPAQFGSHHARGQPRRVEQVADQRGQLVDGLLDGGEQFGGVLGGEADVVAAQARHRGLGGGQRGAQVVADRRQQRAAQLVGLRDRLGLAGLLGEFALLDQARRLFGDRGRAPGGRARAACCPPAASRTRRRRPRSRCRRCRRRRTGPSPTQRDDSPP